MKKSLEKNLKTFKKNALNISKERIAKNLNLLMTFFILGLKKCEASGICVNAPLLKEEAMNIKSSLSLPELYGFKVSEGWFDNEN